MTDDGAVFHWYAVYTRSRHEQKARDRLREKHIETFLPLIERWSRRIDRRKKILLPLFPGYLFVRARMNAYIHLEVLKTKSVVRVLCHDGKPCPVPDEQIDSLQILMKNGIALTPYPYLKEGIRIRVVHGPLTGVEGTLVKTKPNKNRLVISVDLLQESVSVEMDDLDVEPLSL